jgi:hypothetical protein
MCFGLASSSSPGGHNVCGIPSRPADGQLRRTTSTSCHIFTFLPFDDGLLANPKHVEV